MQPTPPTNQGATPPPTTNRWKWVWILLAAGAAGFVFLAVLGMIIGPQESPKDASASTSSVTVAPSSSPSASPVPATATAADPPAEATPTVESTATTPPGGRMNALFCKFTTYEGGAYYVQVFNLTVPGEGMCTAGEQFYTQEEFGEIPGLKRRCSLDRNEQIAQKKAIVSIYSDGTPESVQAARLMCDNTGNTFTE